ncbi:MAG: PHP domain-containing protein [Hungatella sp.]|nr:PHP domain-containing protein [Hungatella sp.]
MAELYYDLHIHSCLSPCGDDDMTPANIVGMSVIKGLDVIAVTDHNSCKNCPAVLAAAEEYGILAIPGMEINTSEEVHAVCLFEELKAAMEFDAYVYERLIPFPNKEEVFGKQQIYDGADQVCGIVPNLLINATDISFDGLWELVRGYGGVMFPAHVDKTANSLIANLGFVPPDSRFVTAEVKDLGKLHKLRKENPYLEGCRIISNSDAHYLEHIHEPELTLHVEEKSVKAVLEALLNGAAG